MFLRRMGKMEMGAGWKMSCRVWELRLWILVRKKKRLWMDEGLGDLNTSEGNGKAKES